jgi:hypothetical protein
LLLAAMGAGSKTTSTQQPSNMLTKNESAKNSGHYLPIDQRHFYLPKRRATGSHPN